MERYVEAAFVLYVHLKNGLKNGLWAARNVIWPRCDFCGVPNAEPYESDGVEYNLCRQCARRTDEGWR
jgi:hypothetical protein